MTILYDAIVAFLCCAGIVLTFWAFLMPAKKKDAYIAGIIISEKTEDIMDMVSVFKLTFKDIVVVTNHDLNGIIDGVKVISPEEFEEYVTGTDQN